MKSRRLVQTSLGLFILCAACALLPASALQHDLLQIKPGNELKLALQTRQPVTQTMKQLY